MLSTPDKKPTKRSSQLTLLDLDSPGKRVLDVLGRFRFLTLRQVQLGLGEAEAGALPRLVASDLLTEIQPAGTASDHDPRPIYALTRAGAIVLGRQKGMPATTFRYYKGSGRRASLFLLDHTVHRSEVALVIERLPGLVPEVKAVAWTHAPERLASAVHLRRPGGRWERVPLVADGVAYLAHGSNKDVFLIEVDRGTETLAYVRRKLRGYEAWWAAGEPGRRFGSRRVRILWVTPTAKRRDSLVELAKTVRPGRKGSGLFWFAGQQDVNLEHPERFLEPIWRTSRLAEPTSLFRQP